MSYQDTIADMQALIARLRKIPGPVLTLTLFVVVFGLGLIVFALSGSVAISALFMALTSTTSALATREVMGRPDEASIRSVTEQDTRQINRRISDISDRLVEIDAEIRHIISERMTPERLRLDVMTRDIERIGAILRDLALVVDANQTRVTEAHFLPDEPRAALMAPTPAKANVLTEKPVPQKPADALAALQLENMLREDILGGKMKVYLHDVMNIESNRVALRKVECKVEGRLADFRSDTDLIKARISPGIIQLFDRMRFGFAYEFANQFGQQSGSAQILCSLMDATFGNPVSADEIIATIEHHPELAGQLILALDYSLLNRPTQAEEQRLKRLRMAGTLIAATLADDMSPDPEILYQLGVGFVLLHADVLLGRSHQTLRSAIHPSDLASYLGRHDIALIVHGVDTLSDLKNLKSINVTYATGAVFSNTQSGKRAADNTRTIADPRPLSPVAKPLQSSIAHEDKGANVPSIAPLRDRLRRVRT